MLTALAVVVALAALIVIADCTRRLSVGVDVIAGFLFATAEPSPVDPEEIREIAVTALGRISVQLAQPGRGGEADYIETRSGRRIGYGELAAMFEAALFDELNARAFFGEIKIKGGPETPPRPPAHRPVG